MIAAIPPSFHPDQGGFDTIGVTLARAVERRWPKVGRWLVALNLTKTRPVYVEPKAAPAVEDAAAQTAY